MRIDFPRAALAVGLTLNLAAGQGFAAAATPVIGTVVTTGAFRLNRATVRSNATLFEGAMVETGAVPASMNLGSGVRLELESESAGRFFGGRLVLERGATKIGRAAGLTTGFQVEALGLTIQPEVGAARGRIVLIGAKRVEVAALTGSFSVLNPGGLLVARIAAGRALALEPQPVAVPSRITGRLVTQGGHRLLTDETTNVTFEVVGSASNKPDLTRVLGQRVEVTGSARRVTTSMNGAWQVIEVAQVTPAPSSSGGTPGASTPVGSGGAGGTAPAGAGGPAAGAGGGGAASGAAISVTMIAIVGGVAAAAVVGGLAATGSLGGRTAAPVSR